MPSEETAPHTQCTAGVVITLAVVSEEGSNVRAVQVVLMLKLSKFQHSPLFLGLIQLRDSLWCN